MDRVWERIETWLEKNAPEVFSGLNPPASPDQISATEKFLGFQFPADVRASYLRHNGQNPASPTLFLGFEWLSLEGIREQWTVWKDLLDGGDFQGTQSEGDGKKVRNDWWNPGWIPLTFLCSGDHHCLDMVPEKDGTVGQIIEMWHDDGIRPVVAQSFKEWVKKFANDLESGQIVLSDEYGGLCRAEDL